MMGYYWRYGRAYKKVNKLQARAKFNRGEQIYLMPSKIRFDSVWVTPAAIHRLTELSFDTAVNAFNYYNCNSATGRCAYYIEVKEKC